jgi:hypothetical protein
VTQAAAVRCVLQPRSFSGAENANPGSEGMTRSKAIEGSAPCARGSVSGPIRSVNSMTEPGQP